MKKEVLSWLFCNAINFLQFVTEGKKAALANIIIDDPAQNVTFLLSTMWKFKNFSVNHILREIKLRKLEAQYGLL